MMTVPPEVAPLIWLLVFLVVCALIYGALRLFEVPSHPKLERLMAAVVVLICVVILIFWVIGLLGGSPVYQRR